MGRKERRGKSKPPAVERLSEPETIAGQLLRAVMLRWGEERDRLGSELKGPVAVDSNVVMNAAFEIAVRSRFNPGADLREISHFVADMRAAFGDDVPMLETEAYIREALGEQVQTSDIDPRTELTVKTFTLMGIKDVLAWEKSDVDRVLVEAETIAKMRGAAPTLVTRS